MSIGLCTTLATTLAPHFSLSKSRLMTLGFLVVGIAQGRTVNLSHLASLFPGMAKYASNYRRLQRFFQYVQLDQETVAQIVVRMLNLSRPKYLALDRTQWRVGNTDINILVLAIVTRRFRVPLMWTMIDHRGNSNTAQRIDLMQRYLALFGASSIELLLCDREFIGVRWMEFLSKNKIPFAIRVRSDMRFSLESGGTWSCQTLLRGRRARRKTLTWTGSLPDTNRRLHLAARRIKSGEWLIVLTNIDDPKAALNAYKKRWAIECLFGDTKTRGLNMEDTRIVNPKKLATLLAVLALAVTWAYRCATTLMGMKAIKRKTHGRREKSWFRTGLDTLRNWIVNQPDKAGNAWTKTCPKHLRAQ